MYDVFPRSLLGATLTDGGVDHKGSWPHFRSPAFQHYAFHHIAADPPSVTHPDRGLSLPVAPFFPLLLKFSLAADRSCQRDHARGMIDERPVLLYCSRALPRVASVACRNDIVGSV